MALPQKVGVKNPGITSMIRFKRYNVEFNYNKVDAEVKGER